MIVFHVHGFSDDRGVREVCVTQSEAENVIAMARPTIERATSTDHTELVRLNRTWPIDGYGQEWAVSQVNAVTRTTLDDGATWHEMWHWFGTASSPWPTAHNREVASQIIPNEGDHQ